MKSIVVGVLMVAMFLSATLSYAEDVKEYTAKAKEISDKMFDEAKVKADNTPGLFCKIKTRKEWLNWIINVQPREWKSLLNHLRQATPDLSEKFFRPAFINNMIISFDNKGMTEEAFQSMAKNSCQSNRKNGRVGGNREHP